MRGHVNKELKTTLCRMWDDYHLKCGRLHELRMGQVTGQNNANDNLIQTEKDNLEDQKIEICQTELANGVRYIFEDIYPAKHKGEMIGPGKVYMVEAVEKSKM